MVLKRFGFERVSRQVVISDDAVLIDQPPNKRGTDESRSTGDENLFVFDHINSHLVWFYLATRSHAGGVTWRHTIIGSLGGSTN